MNGSTWRPELGGASSLGDHPSGEPPMRRNLSALAASILCGHLLEPAFEPPPPRRPSDRARSR